MHFLCATTAAAMLQKSKKKTHSIRDSQKIRYRKPIFQAFDLMTNNLLDLFNYD